MQLVAERITDQIVTDSSTVRQTKGGPRLLTNMQTLDRGDAAVTDSELVWVGEGLDGSTERLDRDQVQILDVIGVLRVGLGPGRSLRDARKTIPSVTLIVSTGGGIGKVENAMIDAGLIEPLASVIPSKLSHYSS